MTAYSLHLLSKVVRAERRAVPSRPAVPSGAESGHKQTRGLFVPDEGPGPLARRGLQGRPTYPSDEGLQCAC
jgi:hypothetical protein